MTTFIRSWSSGLHSREQERLRDGRHGMETPSVPRRWGLVLVVSTAILLAAVIWFVAGSAFAADTETEAVRAAADRFYSALNTMFSGELGPMKEIWSHEDDVTYMGPDGGFRVGWDQVLTDWEKQAAMKLGGKVEPKEMHITVGRDLAIVSNYEVGKNVAEGESRNVSIRATNLFRKEDGTWKMIGHHTDILPFLQK